MSLQTYGLRAGDRVHYSAGLMEPGEPRYAGYAIRKPGETDLDAVLRTINRRLAPHGLEIGELVPLDDGTYQFVVLTQYRTGMREHFSDYQVELRGVTRRRT